MVRKAKREVCVIDAETDPFLYGRVPEPFAWGVRFGDIYMDFWGTDCTAQMLAYLASIKTPLIIYAHNGGKFDFFFLLDVIENPIKIIHGRIAKAKIGIHELRDSWLINPQKLSAYKKDEIDYALFERNKREKHKAKILHYLMGDCNYLYELVSAFVDRFGHALTAPGVAMRELKKLHPQYMGNRSHDERFRPFYYGGRVECFETGVIHGAFKVYDVNSMYPHAMREFDHPLGTKYVYKSEPKLTRDGWIEKFPNCLFFAIVEGRNYGALPIRSEMPNGGLSFNADSGAFAVCSHELRAAISLGLFKPSRIREAYIACNVQRFAGFVDKFSAEKIAAKASKDKIAEIFAKLMLNSAYGKFGQNPDDFYDYQLERVGIDPRPNLRFWKAYEATDDYIIWRKKSSVKETAEVITLEAGEATAKDVRGYFDVAIAASVTSAARSVLMRAIASAKRPLYCDTDSLICEAMGRDIAIDNSRLGAWKHEATGQRLAIAGKKLYALWDGADAVKYACKGVHIDPLEIEAIARGGAIEWRNDAPSFSLDGSARFVKRTAKATFIGRV